MEHAPRRLALSTASVKRFTERWPRRRRLARIAAAGARRKRLCQLGNTGALASSPAGASRARLAQAAAGVKASSPVERVFAFSGRAAPTLVTKFSHTQFQMFVQSHHSSYNRNMTTKDISSLHISPSEAGALGGFFSYDEYQEHAKKEQEAVVNKQKQYQKDKKDKYRDYFAQKKESIKNLNKSKANGGGVQKRKYNRVDRYQILRFIKSWIDTYGESPSLGRIAEYNGLSGPNHSKSIALSLERDGYIKYHKGVRNGISLLKLSDNVKPIDLDELIQ